MDRRQGMANALVKNYHNRYPTWSKSNVREHAWMNMQHRNAVRANASTGQSMKFVTKNHINKAVNKYFK
jgi:hypothetical protein